MIQVNSQNISLLQFVIRCNEVLDESFHLLFSVVVGAILVDELFEAFINFFLKTLVIAKLLHLLKFLGEGL